MDAKLTLSIDKDVVCKSRDPEHLSPVIIDNFKPELIQ